jgi:hypothetical protein
MAERAYLFMAHISEERACLVFVISDETPRQMLQHLLVREDFPSVVRARTESIHGTKEVMLNTAMVQYWELIGEVLQPSAYKPTAMDDTIGIRTDIKWDEEP